MTEMTIHCQLSYYTYRNEYFNTAQKIVPKDGKKIVPKLYFTLLDDLVKFGTNQKEHCRTSTSLPLRVDLLRLLLAANGGECETTWDCSR